MKREEKGVNRRHFLKAFSPAMTGSLLIGSDTFGSPVVDKHLQVWSCGGLAEAFILANKAYQQATGCRIDYSGAFAGALGKSLMEYFSTLEKAIFGLDRGVHLTLPGYRKSHIPPS